MPCCKDLADQKLYRFDPRVSDGAIDVIFRGGLIDTALIVEAVDQLVRVARRCAIAGAR